MDLPYKIIKPENIEPDFTLARKYGAIFRRMSRSMYVDRHQLLFTDNVKKTADMVSSYFLHVDSLSDGRLGALEKALIGVSLSSEEVAASPQLYVNLETGESEAKCYEPGNGDGVNQKRFEPRIFKEIIRFDFNITLYKKWAAEVWHNIGLHYESRAPDKRDVWLFTEWDIAPVLFQHFESNPNDLLFVNDVVSQEKDEDIKMLLNSIKNGLFRELNYGRDHRDYVQRIPYTIWVVPFDLYGKFEQLYGPESYISPSEYPDRSYILHKPFNKWLDGLSEKFKEIDEQEKAKNHNPISSYIKSRLELDLYDISRNLEARIKEQGLSDKDVLSLFGIVQEELDFLKNFKLED